VNESTVEWGARARELDEADPLRRFVAEFVSAPEVVSYLDGNSLGRPLASFAARLDSFIHDDWGARLIRRWDEAWMAQPYELGDRIGRAVLGAAEGQVFVGDSTTVLLYKLIRAAADRAPERDEIIIDDDNFPTDRFVVEGIAAERGLRTRWIQADRVAGVAPEQVSTVLGERSAVVVLSHVAYRSGAIADVPAITAAAHEAGALVVWDLCHSVGVIPCRLDDWGVDLAVGCTYKYLNGGPGAPAFAYVATAQQSRLRQPIWGWMGASDVFAMKDRYEPAGDVRRFASGTPPIVGMLAVAAMMDLVEAAGIEAIRAKSKALTRFTVALLEDYVLPLGATLASPAEEDRRGSHVTVCHPSFREVTARLWERGVIPDFRAPDGIRLGLSPLSTTFAEVEAGVRALGEELRAQVA
jgi:kynureninase